MLAKCAPDPATIQAGKGDSVRARAILRSLISLDDLGNILALRFTIPNLALTSTNSDGTVVVKYVPGGVPRVETFYTLNQFIDTTNTFATIAANLTTKIKAENRLQSMRNAGQSARLRRQFSMEASPTLSQLKKKHASLDYHLKPPMETDEFDLDSGPPSNCPSIYQTPNTSPLTSRRQPEYNAEIFSIQTRKRGFKRRSSTCKIRCCVNAFQLTASLLIKKLIVYRFLSLFFFLVLC